VAASALGAVGEDVAAIRLEQVSRDPAASVRAACGLAVLQLLPPESSEIVVLPMLRDSSEYVRALITGGLGAVNTPKVIDALRRIAGGTNLLDEPAGGRERAAAAASLGDLADTGARTQLLAALADERVAVVATAAGALGKIGADDVEIIEALVKAVRENQSPNEPDIAVSGLTALGELNAAAAEPLATELLASTQPQLREAARTCLAGIAGEERAAELATSHRPPAWQAQPVAPYRTVPATARRAVLRTARGDITLEFFPGEAPRTVANFVRLADEGYFDGVRFHRVVPNFVIQDGDPTGTGWGGPGYAIRCEYNRLRYDTGTVGMALAGKDTGGSQWFITHSPQPHLNGRYTIFAQVIDGLDVLYRIQVEDAIHGIEIER
jgi:cyclophilin family peptidyl-prolyl cis-trans isomerase